MPATTLKTGSAHEVAAAVVAQLKNSQALLHDHLGDARSPEAQMAAMGRFVDKIESIFARASVHVDTKEVATRVTQGRFNSSSRGQGPATVEEVHEALKSYVVQAYEPNSLGISAHHLRGEFMTFERRMEVLAELRAQEHKKEKNTDDKRSRRQGRGHEEVSFSA